MVSAFRLVGKSIRCANGEQSSKIPEFWSECQKAGTFSQLISTDTGKLKGVFGLYRYGEISSKDIEYSIMVAANGRLPEGCSEVRILESTWAVFDCRGAVPPAIQESHGLFGINIYNTDPKDSRKFEYLVAVPSNSDIFDGLSEYTVPARTWAVFPCTQETIGKTEAQSITKWLPKSKYRPLNKGYITGRMKSGAPDIECYGKDGQVEVWIAVKEK